MPISMLSSSTFQTTITSSRVRQRCLQDSSSRANKAADVAPIADYGCALQREILIQGRLYISEHHLSFYANIFGWVTSVSMREIVAARRRLPR